MVVGQLDIHIQKNEFGPFIPYTKVNSKLELKTKLRFKTINS